ncbi:MAG: tRNA-dihydrouridine synthase family protein [Bacteroidaceae bacterium]|nr:tRNA-dihydrouridine synthase family protein [Bacteroidaceae bacterium]
MTIGNISFPQYPVFLAPMEDVTDIGFRLLCRQMGADLVYSEFVSSDALVRGVNRTVEKLEVCDDERPVAIQIYGKFVEAMRDAAQIVVEQAHPDILDINFGCPVKRVAGKGAGAGMLQNIPLMLEITRAVVDAVPDTPVTVKTRLGWDQDHRIIVELAEQLQDCGIQALTIHGRTRSQMYTGEADWTLIGEVKRNPRMHIPIIGNGDITTPERAKECFERYGVDAIMVGRATFGRPWIFKEIKDSLSSVASGNSLPFVGPQPHSVASLKTPVAPNPSPIGRGVDTLTPDWKLNVLKQQVLTSVERLGEYRGILHSRRHLAASPLFKGIPNFRETRIRMLRAETTKELFDIMETVKPIVNCEL